MIVSDLVVETDEFARRTGWTAKPEGLCSGPMCVPAPGAILSDGRLDARVVADRLGMPIEHDEQHGLWALGPPIASGHALSTAEVPDLVLPDRDGNPFQLSSLHGRKVLLMAWASW